MKKTLIAALAGIALFGCSAKESAPKFDQAAMDALLSGAVTDGSVVGVSALVFDEGRRVYKGHFGYSDREAKIAPSDETVWRIYSMTKPITSALIMDLQEDGLLNIDDPVAKYIPALGQMKVASMGEDGTPKMSDQITPMTIKDLLLHRAGLGYGIFGPINPVEELYQKAQLFDHQADLAATMAKLSKLPLVAQPGEGWYYSISIDVLGRIAEIAGGAQLRDLMQTRIFDPLGMSETGFYLQGDQKDRFAAIYNLKEDGSYTRLEREWISRYSEGNKFQSGGGGLVSTMDDYACFAQMILDGGIYKGKRVLNESTVKMMMSDQMDADDKFMMPWLGENTGTGFGYGGGVVNTATPEQQLTNGQFPGQWGWGGAARTNFYVDPKNNAFGVIMLQYFGGGRDPVIHDQFQALSLKLTRNDGAAGAAANGK